MLVIVAVLVAVALLLLAFYSSHAPKHESAPVEWRVRSHDNSLPPEWRDQGNDSNPLDLLYGKLDKFSAVFNWPETIPYDRSTEMIFIIEGDKRGSGDELVESFPGDPERLELRGTDQMSASLSAPRGDAVVTPRGEKQERQRVTRLGATKWIWDVKPERTGVVILTLEAFAHVQLKSKKKTIPDAEVNVLTKRVDIPITVTIWDRTKIYLAEIEPPWKTVGLIGGGIAALLAWLGLWPKTKTGNEES